VPTSSSEYYECHITVLGDPTEIGLVVAHTTDWTFSRIEGDITYGPGTKCYATKHFNARKPLEEVKDELLGTAALLNALGFNVIRRKIERVIYDNRTPFEEEQRAKSDD
jgi:hypothetical protein